MTIAVGQILAQFFWTGTGTGTITAGAAVPGWLLPGTDLNGQTVGYRIENPDTPAQSEVGQGVWNSGASTLTRAVIWANALTGLRNPSAAAINYTSTTAKIVTLVALPADFGALAALATAGTAQITDDAVTNAKLANMATGTVKARSTAATGDPEDRAVGTGLTLDGTSLRADPTTINHDALQNFVANEHIDHAAVSIATQHSLTGGGTIAANRTLNLVNDTASPGNNKTYGTDGAGLRGWKNDPAGAGASLPTDDTTSIARDPVDGTRQMRIDVGAVATSTVRVLSMGNRDVNLAAGGTFPELAHSHDTAEIVAGAVQGDKIYTTFDTAAAPSGGVSTNTLSAAAGFLVATNVAITSVRINNPAAKRNLAVVNNVGASITVANAAGTDIIGIPLVNGCTAFIAWSGSAWTHKVSMAGVARDGGDIPADYSPTHYIPVSSFIAGHLQGIDDALTGGTDASPTDVISSGSPYTLTLGSRMHANARVLSHATNVDFEVPATAAAGSAWRILPKHAGCGVSVVGNPGGSSVNDIAAGAARIISGGIVFVEVDSNAGSAPVVLVRGSVIVPPIDVGTTKTYTDDDSDQEFRLTSTSTQTFGAASAYSPGFEVLLWREVAGSITVAGVDSNYTISGPDVVTVKKVGTALLATGKASGAPIILDAA